MLSDPIVLLFLVLACLILSGIARIVIGKRRRAMEKERDLVMTDFLTNEFESIREGEDIPFLRRNASLFLSRYVRLSQSTLLNDQFKQKAVRFIAGSGIEARFIRRLRSPLAFRRTEAAVFLGYLPTDDSRLALESRLPREGRYAVKLYIANSLSDIGDPSSLPSMIASLPGAPAWYRKKLWALIIDFGPAFRAHLPAILGSGEKEIQELVIEYASLNASEGMKEYLSERAESPDRDIANRALRALCGLYYTEDEIDRCYRRGEPDAVRIAIESAAAAPGRASLARLLPFFGHPLFHEAAVRSAAAIVAADSSHVSYLIGRFNAAGSAAIQDGIAEVLSTRVDYLLVKLISDKSASAHGIIKKILRLGKTGQVIGFLNKNTDPRLENSALSILGEAMEGRDDLRAAFGAFLTDRLAGRLGIEKLPPPAAQRRKEHINRWLLFGALLCAFALFPVIYFATFRPDLADEPLAAIAGQYIYIFNYYFAYYCIALNLSYVLLLVLSYLGAVRQKNYWGVKHFRFLFKRNMLPSISILVPAYNEEASIVQSVTSLLNLQYPDYEVIVVNDGSKDATLSTMIRHFLLERADMDIARHVPTMPVRGVYHNRKFPTLLVVDKENGGKADSLNVGINVSRREYFCGIDADSLLQPESLLKLVSLFLDSEGESAAVGGNIFPVNGCTVESGTLVKIGVPRNWLARLQLVEYIRAFMGGRVGWAFMRSLLIISGAFGVFRKEKVVKIGGYMTSRGQYGRDTVGEDMELVVRLARFLHEAGEPSRIHYACNANCWTEVPESFRVLRRQRDRWHRGLLDIMTYHVRMLLNPRYGSIGLVAFPYYLLFEVIGPWLELQGYFIFFLSAALGLLTGKIVLLLFVATVMFGIFISVFSFIILEQELHYFSFRAIVGLLSSALMENFGIRQFLSMLRVAGYVSALRQAGGWGRMERKGFLRRR